MCCVQAVAEFKAREQNRKEMREQDASAYISAVRPVSPAPRQPVALPRSPVHCNKCVQRRDALAFQPR